MPAPKHPKAVPTAGPSQPAVSLEGADFAILAGASRRSTDASLGDGARDKTVKETMARIGKMYDCLAERAAKREDGENL